MAGESLDELAIALDLPAEIGSTDGMGIRNGDEARNGTDYDRVNRPSFRLEDGRVPRWNPMDDRTVARFVHPG